MLSIGWPTPLFAQFDLVYTVPDDALPVKVDTFGRERYEIDTDLTQVNILPGANFYELDDGVLRGTPLYLGNNATTLDGTELSISGGELFRLYAFADTNTVMTDGEIDLVLAYQGSTLDFQGGTVGRLQAETGSQVMLQAGTFSRLDVDGGSVVVTGAATANSFDVTAGTLEVAGGTSLDYSYVVGASSTLIASGGTLERLVSVTGGASAQVTGSHFAGGFGVGVGSVATLSGGHFDTAFGGGLSAFGDVTLQGGDFRVDGVPVMPSGPTAVTVTSELTGLFANGVPFAFSLSDDDHFRTTGTSFTLQPVALPAATPGVYFVSQSGPFQVVRSGQTLVVDDGGVVTSPLGVQVDAVLRVEPGGQQDDDVEAAGGSVVVEGGTLHGTLKAFQGGSIRFLGGNHTDPEFDSTALALAGGFVGLEGGTIETLDVAGGHAEVSGGAAATVQASQGTVSVTDGAVGDMRLGTQASLAMKGGVLDQLVIEAGSSALIAGGQLTQLARLDSGFNPNLTGQLVVAGGTIDADVMLRGGHLRILGGVWNGALVPPTDPGATPASVAVYGDEFAIDGQPLLLEEGESTVVPLGSGQLTGVLNDGQPWSLDLATPLADNLSEITVFRTSGRQGDYNDDGIVNMADYAMWRNHLGAPEGTLANDYIPGAIGTARYVSWKANFGAVSPVAANQNANVPEPRGVALLILCCSLALLCVRPAEEITPHY